MLLVYFFNVLKQLGLNFTYFYIKWCSKEDFAFIQAPPQCVKEIGKISELLFSPVIDHFKLYFRKSLELFQVMCLLLAQLPSLLDTWFDFTCRWLSGNEIVPRMLQYANPAQTTHTLTIAAVVLNLFFWVIWACFGESLWELVRSRRIMDAYWQRLLEWDCTWDWMDERWT